MLFWNAVYIYAIIVIVTEDGSHENIHILYAYEELTLKMIQNLSQFFSYII